ncbi:MAG: nuclear transport factor 2 family protein [Bdellovibrio sp.]|nr:nuclear transport factor 2 family protein [Bdellovibrio sp.]
MANRNEIEIVKGIYDALNRNDISAIMEFFDPQAVRIEWEGLPSEGTFRGLSELRDHFIKGRSTWAEGGCVPERLTVEGNKVVALSHVHVRLNNKTEWIDGYVGDVFVFRNGKVTEFRSFMTEDEALKWAKANK